VAAAGVTSAVTRVNVTGMPSAFSWNSNPPAFDKDFLTRMLSIQYVWAWNVWLLIFPNDLCADYSSGSIPLLRSLTDPRIAVFVVLIYGLLLLAAYQVFLSHTTSPKSRLVIFMGVALIGIPFLPASNIFFKVGLVIAGLLPKWELVCYQQLLICSIPQNAPCTCLAWDIAYFSPMVLKGFPADLLRPNLPVFLSQS
jgi:hypothetical protein